MCNGKRQTAMHFFLTTIIFYSIGLDNDSDSESCNQLEQHSIYIVIVVNAKVDIYALLIRYSIQMANNERPINSRLYGQR